MAGVASRPHALRHVIDTYNSGAVTASLILTERVMNFNGRISGVVVYAGTAGTGAGNGTVDVQVNGVSIWADAANIPTLAATSTGEFTNAKPSTNLATVRKGDVVKLVAGISDSGHARLMCSVGIELV